MKIGVLPYILVAKDTESEKKIVSTRAVFYDASKYSKEEVASAYNAGQGDLLPFAFDLDIEALPMLATLAVQLLDGEMNEELDSIQSGNKEEKKCKIIQFPINPELLS